MMEGTMADIPAIKVTRIGDKHVCNPTHTPMNPGDRVSWTGREPFFVFFPDKTPFVEGRGPFTNGEKATVRGDVEEDTFKPKFVNDGVFLKETEGDVQHP
jgi:hypothetical protein